MFVVLIFVFGCGAVHDKCAEVGTDVKRMFDRSMAGSRPFPTPVLKTVRKQVDRRQH